MWRRHIHRWIKKRDPGWRWKFVYHLHRRYLRPSPWMRSIKASAKERCRIRRGPRHCYCFENGEVGKSQPRWVRRTNWVMSWKWNVEKDIKEKGGIVQLCHMLCKMRTKDYPWISQHGGHWWSWCKPFVGGELRAKAWLKWHPRREGRDNGKESIDRSFRVFAEIEPEKVVCNILYADGNFQHRKKNIKIEGERNNDYSNTSSKLERMRIHVLENPMHCSSWSLNE